MRRQLRGILWTTCLLVAAAPVAAIDGELDTEHFYPPNGRIGFVGGGIVADGGLVDPDGMAVALMRLSGAEVRWRQVPDEVQAATHCDFTPPLATEARYLDALFDGVPEALRLKRPLDLPPALPEQELQLHLREIAGRNRAFDPGRCFLGAGGYGHFVPAVVDALSSRGEFLSAYTPYQAEASQGTLQHIFEFQTMICELTGMDVATASHYDGATALHEAVAMSLDRTERTKVVLSGRPAI